VNDKIEEIVKRLLAENDLEAAYVIQHLQAREVELEEQSDALHKRNAELNQELHGSGRGIFRGWRQNDHE